MKHHAHDDEHFRQTRESFDDMDLRDQASFLLEASMRTVARGAETLGRALGDEIDRMFERGSHRKKRPGRESRCRREDTGGPGPAEPETSRQRASGNSSER